MTEELKTKRGKIRQRAPGGGRKPHAATRLKKAMEVVEGAHPELIEAMIQIAKGEVVWIKCPECKESFRQFKCPKCKKTIEHECIGKADREMLIHLDNRILGKPKQTTEIDLNAHVEVNNIQLNTMLQKVLEYQRQLLLPENDPDIIEGEIKEIPVPTIPPPESYYESQKKKDEDEKT